MPNCSTLQDSVAVRCVGSREILSRGSASASEAQANDLGLGFIRGKCFKVKRDYFEVHWEPEYLELTPIISASSERSEYQAR